MLWELQLAALLPTASFVAIDEEMTGIHLPGVFVERMADSTEERYAKMKSVAEHYKIIQIGLCLFHEVPHAAGDNTAIPKFEARPYNFYLFPEEGAVNMEAAAIAFNKNHGMVRPLRTPSALSRLRRRVLCAHVLSLSPLLVFSFRSHLRISTNGHSTVLARCFCFVRGPSLSRCVRADVCCSLSVSPTRFFFCRSVVSGSGSVTLSGSTRAFLI